MSLLPQFLGEASPSSPALPPGPRRGVLRLRQPSPCPLCWGLDGPARRHSSGPLVPLDFNSQNNNTCHLLSYVVSGCFALLGVSR